MRILIRSLTTVGCVIATLILFDPSAFAAPTSDFTQQARLATGEAGATFGAMVSVSGNTAVAGSTRGVYVYVRTGSGWSQQTLLVPTDGVTGFGGNGAGAVIDGDTVFVLAPNAAIGGNVGQGAVYVFVRSGSTWTEQQRLTASDGAANDFFGVSLSVSGDTLIVGETGDDVGANVDQGSAYVFHRSGGAWTEQAKLLAEDGASRNFLGIQVAIDGDTAVVSRNRAMGAAIVNPAVYVFVRNGTTWQQQQKLSVCDPSASNLCNFGNSVAVKGNLLAVGNSYLNSGGNTAVGGVYIFDRSAGTWTQMQRLVSPNGSTNSEFGSAMSTDGQTLVIGAEGDFGGPPGGSVYIYTKPATDWVQHQELKVPNVTYWNSFGHSVSFSGDTILVGAPRDNGTSPYIGAAYVFMKSPAMRPPFDFDGDGKTDVSIFRPGANAEWWISKSSDSSVLAAQFGTSGDKPVPADYTGDGKADLAFFRPATGFWYILRSEDFSFYGFEFGIATDIPAPADFDGDGKADVAIYRSGIWHILRSSAGYMAYAWGRDGDKPIPADYDGDGKADMAIFRPNGATSGEWWIPGSAGSVLAAAFASAQDMAAVGDWTGDGKADIAFFRPSTGYWYVLRSEDQSFYGFPFGLTGDVPAPGDYDGDGKMDAAVFRQPGAAWYVNKSSGGVLSLSFGTSGDLPVPGSYVR